MQRVITLRSRIAGDVVLPHGDVLTERYRAYLQKVVRIEALSLVAVVTEESEELLLGDYLALLEQQGETVADVRLLQAFWSDQQLIPLGWRTHQGCAMPHILFPDSVFKLSSGHNAIYYLCFHPGEDRWRWGIVRSYERLHARQFAVHIGS